MSNTLTAARPATTPAPAPGGPAQTHDAPAPAVTLPPPVTPAQPQRGEPGQGCFTGWLAGQPADDQLTNLATHVQQVEADFENARAAIPDLIAKRVLAEDGGDGAAYSDAVASLGGLPRLLGKLAGQRVGANLRFLARLAVVAETAAIAAETSLSDVRAGVRDARRDLHRRRDSGRVTHEGGMSDGETGCVTTLIRTGMDKLATPDEAAQRAREIVAYCVCRSRFYDLKGDASRLDLRLPQTWYEAIDAQAASAQKTAHKEIRNG